MGSSKNQWTRLIFVLWFVINFSFSILYLCHRWIVNITMYHHLHSFTTILLSLVTYTHLSSSLIPIIFSVSKTLGPSGRALKSAWGMPECRASQWCLCLPQHQRKIGDFKSRKNTCFVSPQQKMTQKSSQIDNPCELNKAFFVVWSAQYVIFRVDDQHGITNSRPPEWIIAIPDFQ